MSTPADFSAQQARRSAPAPGLPVLRWSDAWLLEAVRLAEAEGPLDDTEALHAALASAEDDRDRLLLRGRRLGARLGLPAAIAQIHGVLPWVLIALAVLVVLAGGALAGQVVGTGNDSHRINAIAALGSLLGLHVLTLLVWAVGAAWSPGAWRHSFGGVGLTLSVRIAGGAHGQAGLLMRAAARLLGRSRTLPWLLGLASHAVWTLSFAVALGSLLFALSFHRYTLGWETTILEPRFFVQLVHGLGYVPSLLGFPVPSDVSILMATGSAAPVDPSGQRDWALWVAGCLAIYGLLPRLLLALLCAALLRARRGALLTLDLQAPYYRQVLERMAALVPATEVVDCDPGRPAPARAASPMAAQDASGAQIAIGFELATEAPWPPTGWPAETDAWRCDGSATSRKELLTRLAKARPARVLLVCDGAASPDRGTERFMREVLARSGRVDFCLLGTAVPEGFGPLGDSNEAYRQRWQQWLSDSGLAEIHPVADPAAWLAASDAAPRGSTVQ